MSKIFISYRRADSAGTVGRIHDRLVARFGEDAIFMDIDAIPPGADFKVEIRNAIERCVIQRVVIGPRWLDQSDADGRPRLDDPNDPVRLEVEAALQRDITIIPLLVDGTSMPSANRLPTSIQGLSTLNALPLRNDRDFDTHIRRVIATIEKLLADELTAPRHTHWERRANQPDAPSRQGPGMGGLGPEERAAQTAAQLLTQVQASPALVNRDMYPVAMNHFLKALSAAVPSRDVPILVGRDGSPLPHLGQILADRLAFRRTFAGQQDQLNGYTAVYRLDFAVLCRLATVPNGVDAVRVLQIIKQYVFDHRSILQLDHVEALRTTGQADPALRGELANRGPCLTFGVYFVTEETDPKREAQLNLPNTRVVPVSDYTGEETKDFIKQYYAPQWERQGYTFATDAFDSVILLEPGAWVDLKRKTLPYLVVDLAVNTIQAADGGDNSIRATALAALGALQDIWRYEFPNAPAEVQTQFQDILQVAETDIRALLQRPTPATRRQRKVLTRAHVVSQLLCPNDSAFHLPGHTTLATP